MTTILHRFLIKWHSAIGTKPPQWLREKCEGDPALRELLADEESLTRSLESQSPEGEDVEVSPFLEGRILRAIDESKAQPIERGSSWLWTLALTFGGVSAAAAALALFFMNSTPDPSPEAGFAVEDTAVVEEAVNALASVELEDIEELIQPEWQNPLDRELENVLVDGKRALNFLAGNFVPKKVSEKWSQNIADQLKGSDA